MVDINTVYQTKFLSASDIGDTPMLATVNNVTFEDMQDGEQKLCVWFNEVSKGLLLNKTNARNIASFLGSETDNWIQQKIVLQTALVDFQGKTTEAIRVRAPKAPAAKPVAQAAPQAGPPPGHPASLNDSVPF